MSANSRKTVLWWIPVLCSMILFGQPGIAQEPTPAPEKIDPYRKDRQMMIEKQIRQRGVKDPRVLAAMEKVPRHQFVPEDLESRAYEDNPLPIGEGQTISQPYIVAFMTEKMNLEGDEKVLEIGTGSGYQAAILGQLAREVYTIEIVPSLGRSAREKLEKMGYDNIHVRIGDGYKGWPEAAPFDAIMLTAAPDHVPQPLVDQLAENGRMILPVGDAFQNLRIIRKKKGKVHSQDVMAVRFVPMTGEAENR
jgi:protein-L-isoaspartate(D-aspartate) O-methyltransferase